jgi:hypothetical protein
MQSSTQANNNRSNTYFLLAFGLINITGLTLLFCTAGLLLHIGVSWWQFPAACLLALAVNYYLAGFFMGEKAKRGFVKTSLLIVALLAASIYIANCFYDFSFDGQWYHQETVYRLNNTNDWCFDTGRGSLTVIPVNLKMLNINYFSKSAEIVESAIYQSTHHIECGKALNIILMAASLFMCVALLYKVDRVKTGSKWLLAFLFACNPITLAELFTYCVDGFAASLMLCMLAIFGLLLLQQNRYYYYLLGCLIVITANVKFTTLVYEVVFCAGFLLILLIYKRIAVFKQALITCIIAFFIGVFCCGFNPYITNTILKHNVFYGLGDTRIEIKRLTPAPLIVPNRFETLFLSLTSHQGWHVVDTTPVNRIPKIPFAVNKSDLLQNTELEPSVSGFGPFFSGSLLLAIIIFIIAAIYHRKTAAFKYALAAILTILITVLIIPDPWWSRFVPQLWLIPVIILCMAELMAFRFKKPLGVLLYLSMALNVVWSSVIFAFVLFNTARVNYQLQQLRAINKPVNMEFCSYRSFKSNRIRFIEAGIPVTDKDIGKGYEYPVTYSTSKVKTAAPLPALPKPFLMKLADKMTGK